MPENSSTYTPLPQPIPIAEHQWPDGTKPLVCVRVMVYNHEKYLLECLDGIVVQKTTFPVWVVVHDDASTDSSPEILREYEAKYPGVLKVIYQKENTYSKPNKIELRRELTLLMREGKYNAICEGDDYWTDTMKLQKQVAYLESHEDCSLVASRTYVQNGEEKRLSPFWGNEITFNRLLKSNIIGNATCSVVFKRAILNEEYYTSILPKARYSDWMQWIYLLEKGRGYCFEEPMACYRQHDGGIWSALSTSEKIQNLTEMYDYLKTLYPNRAEEIEGYKAEQTSKFLSYEKEKNAVTEHVVLSSFPKRLVNKLKHFFSS